MATILLTRISVHELCADMRGHLGIVVHRGGSARPRSTAELPTPQHRTSCCGSTAWLPWRP